MADYNPEDWENIPVIIPKSITGLVNEIRSIQSWMKAKDSEESTSSLSLKIQKLQSQVNSQFEGVDQKITDQINSLKKDVSGISDQLSEVKVAVPQAEAVAQTDMKLEDFDQNEDLSEEEHSEDEAEPSQSKADPHKMRMFSLNNIKSLCFKYLNRSKLKSKFKQNLETALPELHSKIDQTNSRIESTVNDFKLEIERVYEQVNHYKESMEKIYQEIDENLISISKWSEKLEQQMKVFGENISENREKQEENATEITSVGKSLESLREKFTENSKDFKESLKKKTENLQKLLKKEDSKLRTQIEDLAKELNQKLTDNKNQLQSDFQERIQDLLTKQKESLKKQKDDISQQIYEYNKIHESDLESFQKTYNEDKTKTHETITEINQNHKKLKKQVDKWISTVIEPAHISEARIFAVEARVKEEESSRLHALHFLKDTIKKLIFSLEQAQSSLPPVRPKSRADNSENYKLFMKRLDFLKKVVDYSEGKKHSAPSMSRTAQSQKYRISRSLAETKGDSFITEQPTLNVSLGNSQF